MSASLIKCNSPENPILVWSRLVEYAGQCNQAAASVSKENIDRNIRDLFSKNNIIQLPPDPITAIDLFIPTIALIGAWKEDNEFDCKMIEQISGMEYSEFEAKARTMLSQNSEYLQLMNGNWKVCHKEELLNQCKNKLFDDSIGKLLEVVESILRQKSKCVASKMPYFIPVSGEYDNSLELRGNLVKSLCWVKKNLSELSQCNQEKIENNIYTLVSTLLQDAKALSDYAGAFDALSLVPVIGSGVAAILKTLAQAKGAELMECADLDMTRRILEDALIQAEKKIIIVIDDIDRLANSQIRDVFQLVKQVADFPNVIYLLAMDREVVRRALTDVHNIDGNEYLEKIIQVPFELPELKKSKLHNIFLNKLDQIINDLPGEVIWDRDYWSSVFRNCVEPYINTLRDVNRMINTFQFRYGTLYKEIAFEDMVGMTTLEVLEPELYKWICNNKEAVCGGFMHGFLSHSSNKPDYRNLYYDEFKSLGIDPDLAISCVSTMFPVFANDVNEYQYGYQPVLNIRSKMRIAYEGRFELYFMFDLDDIKVSRSVINACIYKFDRDVLSKAVEKINEEGNIVYFLEEIRSLVDKIPYKRLGLVASALLGLREEFKEENSEKLFTLSASDIAGYLIEDIIERLKTEEEKYGIICSVIENVDITGLGIMARLINRMELAYGRLAGNSEEKDKQIISLTHLEKLEDIYVAKVRDIVNSEFILDRNEFNNVFYLWKCFDKDGVEAYLKGLLKTEVNKLKFICAMATKWHSTNGSGWRFYPQNYSEYISQNEVYNMIQGFDKSKLNQFTDIEQIKLASFALNYNKNEMDHADEQAALNLISEWKTGKAE